MKVTFIGLGIMGSRMVEHLLANNIELTVFNRSKSPMIELQKKGADIATSAQQAVREADIVFTMLSTPEVVKEVVWSKNGFISQMKEQALWVDCSTVNPAFSRQSREISSKHHIRFLDAPVAGSIPQAEKRELVFFVGGAKDDVTEIEPLLQMMGSKVMHIGETGMGTSYKLLVNAMLAQSMIAFAEAVLLGEKLGVSRDFLLDTLPHIGVIAPFTKAKAEIIRAGTYEALFPLELMHKDLHLAALTAYEKEQPLYLANLAKELYANAKQEGLGRKDFSAIFAFLDSV
jgi:3-hydroxyisobutyrate dehydrogenase-like beta-hydroxyacid dehydrogenase